VADEPPQEAQPWTLGAIRARGMRLEGACKSEGCGHFVVFDLERLIEGLGADYPLRDAVPGIPCQHCGGELKFQLAVWHSDHQSPDEPADA
jgi:hypothetical protein